MWRVYIVSSPPINNLSDLFMMVINFVHYICFILGTLTFVLLVPVKEFVFDNSKSGISIAVDKCLNE